MRAFCQFPWWINFSKAWPWPGAYKSSSLAALARLRALGALARLGGKLQGVAWYPSWLNFLDTQIRSLTEKNKPGNALPNTETIQSYT